MGGPYVPSWRKDDGDIITKTKSEYNQDDYEKLKKNCRVLYVLQCAINGEIFDCVCSCEIAKNLWEKFSLIYEERSQEKINSSRRDEMLNNSNDEEITHLCLIANDGVENRDTSDKDDDDDEDDDGLVMMKKKRRKPDTIA